MAVITKYFIVRNGVELDKVFVEKKEADAYDKMLDAAEKLAELIKQGDLEIELDEKVIREVSIFLAKNAPEVNKVLKGVKSFKPKAPSAGKSPKKPDKELPAEKKPPEKKPATAKKGN